MDATELKRLKAMYDELALDLKLAKEIDPQTCITIGSISVAN